jgi:hypothetical protein
MNKRMKDPKGDLRFVHKSTRVYDFCSLKLTAMVSRRQVQHLTTSCFFYLSTTLFPQGSQGNYMNTISATIAHSCTSNYV